jgi:hypothetical protein
MSTVANTVDVDDRAAQPSMAVRVSLPAAVAAAASALAGTLHHAAAVVHRPHDVTMAVVFTAVGVGQLVWPVGLAFGRRRSVLVSGAALHVVAIVLWFVSRTVGLPVGADAGQAEPLGVVDVACVAAEVVVVAMVIVMWRGRGMRYVSA